MVALNKKLYWQKLVDYYYEHIHFLDYPDDRIPSIVDWLERDFGASASRYSDKIRFDNPADATMFTLKWQ